MLWEKAKYMRVVMPFFGLKYKGNRFQFSDNYSLERFNYNKDVPKDLDGLSEIDVSHLSLEDWAIVSEKPDMGYRSEINLLLLAFRVYANSSAFIKWRFCDEDSENSSRIGGDMRFRNLAMTLFPIIEETALSNVREGFLKLLEMNQISDRTKNALYFICRGLCSSKHIDAYIFLVCALEALFSNETPENVTKILIKRIQKFLSGIKGCGGDQVKKFIKFVQIWFMEEYPIQTRIQNKQSKTLQTLES